MRLPRPALIVAVLVLSCDRGGEPKESEDAAGGARASSAPPSTQAIGGEQQDTPSQSETLVVPPPSPLSGVAPTLASMDEATKQRAAALAEQRERKYFPAAIAKPNNGPAFLYLALSSSDPAEVAAALGQVKTLYGPEDKHRERKVDDDYRKVILYRLASKDAQIAEAAFEAASTCVWDDPANADVIPALVDFAFHHPQKAGRLLALKALTRRWNPPPQVQDAFLHALDAEDAAFVALTLERISFSLGSRFSKREALQARLKSLLKHGDPAIRATAVAALAESSLRGDRDEAARELLPLLEDPHPFVRAAVLNEMGTLRHLPALEAVFAHLDRTESAEYEISWVGLDGGKDRDSLLLHRDSIGLVALEAIKWITKDTEHAFVLSGLGAKDADGGLAQGAKEARAWFEASGTKLSAQGS